MFGICAQQFRNAGRSPSRRKFVESEYGCARPRGRNALTVARKQPALASAATAAAIANGASRSTGSPAAP